MSVVCLIVMLAASLEFSFSLSWLSSSMNSLADSASRFQYSHLFSLAPYLNRQSSSTNPHTVGIKYTLISHLQSHSSSGTSLPQVPDERTIPANVPISTSSLSTQTYSMQMAPTSQPAKELFWNGLRTWAPHGISLLQQSRHTWDISKPSMSTPTAHSMLSKPQLLKGSSAVSSVTSVITLVNQPHPSGSTSFTISSRSHSQHHRSSQQTWMQPLSSPSLDSCTLENSQSKIGRAHV